MSEFKMGKVCQICEAKIPDDFQNLLCLDCYGKIDQHNREAEEERVVEIKKNPDSGINPKNLIVNEPIKDIQKPPEAQKQPIENFSDNFGITDPNYKENSQQDDKDQILANIAQFVYTHDPSKGRKGKMLWYPTRNMYTYIKNRCIKYATEHPQYPKAIWKPKIVDVGCGCGVGSNVMSQEADFVWGIDKNEWSIEFAKECFTREKNGIYYNSQLTFDIIDIMEDSREFMKFDIVVAIEIIEHIHDTHKFLKSLIQFTKTDKKGNPKIEGATEFYISTPNRNSPKIKDDQPQNPYHVREWTAQEFDKLLSKYFEQVEFMDNTGKPIAKDAKDDLIFAKAMYPKI